MISMLRGNIAHKENDAVTLDVQGVGYLVFISNLDNQNLQLNETYTLFISTIVREDAITLFGFIDKVSKDVFDILRGVNKVGPKLALTIIGSISVPELALAVENKDTITLSKIPGIGKKTAERMCLELKNKLSSLTIHMPKPPHQSGVTRKTVDPLQLALAQLDYRKSEIDVVLGSDQIPSMEKAPIEERLRAALIFLAKQN